MEKYKKRTKKEIQIIKDKHEKENLEIKLKIDDLIILLIPIKQFEKEIILEKKKLVLELTKINIKKREIREKIQELKNKKGDLYL